MRAFRYRDYRIFWTGALISNTGTWVLNLTLPFVLFQLTGSAVWVGAAVVAQFLPMFAFSPLGGSVADQYPRRAVLLILQTAMGVGSVLVWLAWVSDIRSPAVLLALVAVVSALNGVSMPSWQGFVHDLVPRDALLSAVTLNSLQFNGARALGPAIGGVLLATLGPSWAFGLNAVSYLCIIVALLLVRAGRGQRVRRSDLGFLQQMSSAVQYVASQPGILIAFVVAFIVGFLGNPVFSFTVVFADDVFNVGPVQLGIMNAAIGLGSLAVAPLVGGSRWVPRLSTMAGIGLVIYGFSLIGFALAPSYQVSVVTLVVVGGCFLAVIASTNTASQVIVADSYRGRVLAMRLMIFTMAAPLGGLMQGGLTDALGARSAFVISGTIMVILAIVLLTLRGPLRLARLDDEHDARSAEEIGDAHSRSETSTDEM